ncbi:polysaccharide pyruvyl transferase family protein [Roseicyclus marinus]|uniref:polysaccharide pyruvyl transferase family protein n=1 Tax=Roseicyclus marinus TaxID=2161673 RepID=UPI00240EDA4F|nr:polysaccharide pyruvyl transferase family protein [Roseicyclus marinus]MDG3041560.1 polysaccharide pyruvyl transferase family protein [Roseicyclus marinus]
MRAFFHPANPGYTTSLAKISGKAGLPLQSVQTIRQLRSQISASSANVGNVVHNEAIAKTFGFDTAFSAMGGIEGFFKAECNSRPKEFQQKLSQNFDAVFFSFANLVAPPLKNGKEEMQRRQFSRLCEIVNSINIPLIVLGVGLQQRLESTEEILPELAEFMREINRKAVIFGCRGAETEAYLQSIGCDNVRALGCPSLYVYPSRILAIEPLGSLTGKSGITAGYLDRKHFLGHQPHRLEALSKIASTLDLSYVFQNDLLTLSELDDTLGLYIDADNRCDPEIINAYIESFGYKIPISDYRFFRDPRSWRQYAGSRDYFFGDRFHGGVVSLQTGRPALFIYDDVRVMELTEHFALPSVSLEDVISGDVHEILENGFSKESIDRMHDTYSGRLNEYFGLTKGAGLTPLRGIYPVQKKNLDATEDDLTVLKTRLGEVLESERMDAAIQLAAMNSWTLAGVERLLNILAELKDDPTAQDVLNLAIVRQDTAPDEAMIFRTARVLFKARLDQSCEFLLRYFFSRNDVVWTERVARILIESLIRQENFSDAKAYLSSAMDRGCLNANVARLLLKRTEQ